MAILKGSRPGDGKGWNPREAPRHAIPEGILVNAGIELANGSRFEGRCLNIGTGGAHLELVPGTDPTVPVNTKALLTLELHTLIAEKIPCLIRHCQDHHLGLFFPDGSRHMVDSNNPFSQIIRTIEREVLRTKTNGVFG